MSVIQHLWRGRRVRVAGALDQVAVDRPDDMAAIYQQYWELVYKRCLATLGNEQAAEDATQDVFLLALSNFEQVQHDVVRGLLDIARTISYERRRRPAREVSLANPGQHSNGSGADDPAEIAERHGVLTAVWSGLSPVERRYVADKFAGFSFEEIAQRNRRKLGTVSSNLFRAREHARSLRGPTLPALLGVAGWRRLSDLTRRARNSAHAASTAAAAQPVQTLTVSLTLAGLLAGVTPAVSGGSGSRADGAGPTAVVPPTQLPIDASGSAAPVGGVSGGSRPGVAVAYAARSHPASSGASPTLPLTSPASAETPEDTVIYTATPSPNYDSDHTILAIGRGMSCGCPVLLVSPDGGMSWTASTGVPDGDQLVLPPDYPRDPRIFVGYQFEAPGMSNWWAPTFGAAFQPMLGPAGAIALPAGFDTGDERAIISTTTGVWSEDLARPVLHPLLVETRPDGSAAVATPLGAVGTGVLAMTTSSAVAPGAAANVAGAPGLTLWACPPGRACETRGAVPLQSANGLVTSRAFGADHTLAVWAHDAVMTSSDGGTTFSALAIPAGATAVGSLTLGRGTSMVVPVWLVVQRGSAFALDLSTNADGNWHDVSDGLTQITGAPGRVIALGPHRTLFLSSAGGLLCTSNDGATWAPRCAAV
jgi:DNA-directed RNA polymerase specialized sigma24 family protein